MAFIQHCFIRKNTPELREKLEEIGRKLLFSARYGCRKELFTMRGERGLVQACNGLVSTKTIIDCGTNEEMFLALAALRDDTDYMQWFICGDNESMFKVDKPDMSVEKYIHEYMDGWDTEGYRKATAEEIVEHFKDK